MLYCVILNLFLKQFIVEIKNRENVLDHLKDYIKGRFNQPRIAFIGLQPAMIAALKHNFKIRVVDLDADNIGKIKAGVLIESVSKTKEILSWGDIIFGYRYYCCK